MFRFVVIKDSVMRYDTIHFYQAHNHTTDYFPSTLLKGIVGHRTAFPNEPVCYLSLEIFFNTFHSVLLVAEITGARLAQVDGNC